MGFREREKGRLMGLKGNLFSSEACEPGWYKRDIYLFCLAADHSSENLHRTIRSDALDYFRARKIPWHDGYGPKRALPSNHLCCSQSACVNFWFPFVRQPAALRGVLQDIGYPVAEVLPFEVDEDR